MPRRKRTRILCGSKVPKGELELLRDKMVNGTHPGSLAQRAVERGQVAQLAEDTDEMNRKSPTLRAAIMGLDEITGRDYVIDMVDIPKSKSRVAMFVDEMKSKLSNTVGMSVGYQDGNTYTKLIGSEVIVHRDKGSSEAYMCFKHPTKDKVVKTVADFIDTLDLPDVDALRKRFGFNFTMPYTEQPVDLQGRQMAKPILSAVEDYAGKDRAEVLKDVGLLVGMHGISTNEARFLVQSLNAVGPGETYSLVTRIQRYDKIDELTDEGISCIGRIRDVNADAKQVDMIDELDDDAIEEDSKAAAEPEMGA